MDIFLRAKHWQLFLLTFGIPIIFEIALMGSLFSNIMHNPNPNPAAVLGSLKFFPLIMLLFMGTLFSWFWAVATGLQKFMPPGVNMKLTRFKVFFFIPLVYLILIMVGISVVLGSNITDITNPAPFFIAFLIIFPLHIFSMFCIFYCLYFVAKTLKTVELQRETSFSDFVGEFFLAWFFPIGVWILQPKINKLMQQNALKQPDDYPIQS